MKRNSQSQLLIHAAVNIMTPCRWSSGHEERKEKRRRRERDPSGLESSAPPSGAASPNFDTEATPPLSDQVPNCGICQK